MDILKNVTIDANTVKVWKDFETKRFYDLHSYWVTVLQHLCPKEKVSAFVCDIVQAIGPVLTMLDSMFEAAGQKVSLYTLIEFRDKMTLEIRRLNEKFANLARSLGLVPNAPPESETKDHDESPTKEHSKESADGEAGSDEQEMGSPRNKKMRL